MKLSEALKILEGVEEISLSDEFCKKYNMYDNSGVIINSGEEINGILFCLDLSEGAVEKALQTGANLIITHHPAIYGGISKLDCVDNPQAKVFAKCIKNGISVVSMHLNFDTAPKGIDFYLMRGLGGEDAEILADSGRARYGRVYDIQPKLFVNYIEHIKTEFCTDKVWAFGNDEKVIKRVASFCGAGCDETAIAFAAEKGADAFVSSDLKHHEIIALLARGINVIQLTHFASENYGFKKIYQDVKDKFKVDSAYYDAEEML